jgi:hypothetical protein
VSSPDSHVCVWLLTATDHNFCHDCSNNSPDNPYSANNCN